jgi:hypothetical protein
MVPSFALVGVVVFAIFFYRAGEFEDAPGLLWAALSVLVSVLVLRWLRWGMLGLLLGQAGLFVGIAAYRVIRKD